MAQTNPNFLNGVPEMLILHMLSQKAMYGYQLVKAIQARSDETFDFGEGCVYPILHYLQKHKLLTCSRQEVDSRIRNYYHITPKGRERLKELRNGWEEVIAGVATVLGKLHA
jgi:PadR family transcriptional regulator PadR